MKRGLSVLALTLFIRAAAAAGVPGQVQLCGCKVHRFVLRLPNLQEYEARMMTRKKVEIVLLDVKTVRTGLNGIQRRVEAAVAEKRMSFDVLRLVEPPRAVPVQKKQVRSDSSSVRLGRMTGRNSCSMERRLKESPPV